MESNGFTSADYSQWLANNDDYTKNARGFAKNRLNIDFATLNYTQAQTAWNTAYQTGGLLYSNVYTSETYPRRLCWPTDYNGNSIPNCNPCGYDDCYSNKGIIFLFFFSLKILFFFAL